MPVTSGTLLRDHFRKQTSCASDVVSPTRNSDCLKNFPTDFSSESKRHVRHRLSVPSFGSLTLYTSPSIIFILLYSFPTLSTEIVPTIGSPPFSFIPNAFFYGGVSCFWLISAQPYSTVDGQRRTRRIARLSSRQLLYFSQLESLHLIHYNALCADFLFYISHRHIIKYNLLSYRVLDLLMVTFCVSAARKSYCDSFLLYSMI